MITSTANMYLCNASIGLSQEGRFRLHFANCTRTLADGNLTGNGMSTSVDSFGAMQYTVAVIGLYGIAMLGVFCFGKFRRRKRRNDTVDKETQMFLKNYDEVRRVWEQRSRVGAISTLLHNLHNEPMLDKTNGRGRPSINSLAFLPITLSKINEDSNTDMSGSTASLDSITSIYASGLDVTGSSDQLTLAESKPPFTRDDSRVSMLGSSRRTFSACKRCLWLRNVKISKHECPCNTPAKIGLLEGSALNRSLGAEDMLLTALPCYREPIQKEETCL